MNDYFVFVGDKAIGMTIRANRHFFSNNGFTTPTNFIFLRITDNSIRSPGTLIEQFIGRLFLHGTKTYSPTITNSSGGSHNSGERNVEYSANLPHPNLMKPPRYRESMIAMFLRIPLLIICGLVTSPAQDAAPSSPARSLAGLGRFEKTLGGEREIRTRVEAFFKGIENGKPEAAFGTLMQGSPLGENTESVDKLVAETQDIVKTYGEVRDHELIKISRLGSRIIRFTYFTYSDNYPLKWEIYCFLGKSGWQILDFSVNNKFTELFDKEKPK